MSDDSKECCQKALGTKRYLLATLACFGLLIPLGMRCEIGIAIIKLTESHNMVVPAPSNNISNNYKVIKVREVAWSNTKVSLIEASFYIGYTLFSIPGGFLSTIFPANRIFGLAVLISAFLNFIIPLLVIYQCGFLSVFVIRIFQGMSEGCLYPSVHSFWRYWAPKQERSKLITISFFGMAVGPIIGYPISGILTKRYDWHANFYFWGIIAILWAILWLVVSRKCPSQDNCISEAEKIYIEQNTSQMVITASQVPWKYILTSVPVWAIIIANIGRNWTYQFSFSGLPSFLRKKFNDNSINLGFHMSIPYIIMAILTPAGGVVADCMIKRKFSVVFVRKLFNSVGFGIAGVMFLFLGFIPYLWLATTTLSIGLGSFGIGISGFGVNHLDIADIYAGVLMGISNGIGTLAGILAPIIAMEITKNFSVNDGWMIFFILSGIIHLITVTFYAIFASGENQSWSVHTEPDGINDPEKKPLPNDSQ